MKGYKKAMLYTAIALASIFLISMGAFLATKTIATIPNVQGAVKVIAALVIMVGLIGIVVCLLIYVISKGAKNITSCEGDTFREIDKYRPFCSKNDNLYYERQIQIINKFYKPGGALDSLVAEEGIMLLYLREDYLNSQNEAFYDIKSSLIAFIISALAAYYVETDEKMTTSLGIVICALVIVLALMATVLFRYIKRGRGDSYEYLVKDYERKLLKEKIEDVEKRLVLSEDDEQLLETSHVVFEALNNIWRGKHGKVRKALSEDISKIKKLNLCIGDGENYYIRDILVGGKTCHLVYLRDKGKENNYIGEKNLYNKDYVELYDILSRHNLISCWCPMEQLP